MSASLFARSNAQHAPVHSRLQVSALQPGDVLLFGVFERECEERLCSDIVSILNALGGALMPERYAAVPAQWACHAAIYAGDNKLVHATGPETTFVLAVDEIEPYLAEHPRLCTVFRSKDRALARRAAALALAVASVERAERRYSVPCLLVLLGLQAVFPGRCDEALAEAVVRSARERTSCFDASGALLSCSSFVSTLFHVAAEGRPLRFACDLSPYDLFVELANDPAWRLVTYVRPDGLSSTPLPAMDDPRAAYSRSNVERVLPFILSLLGGACVVLAFAVGLGRALHQRLMRSIEARSNHERSRSVALEGALP